MRATTRANRTCCGVHTPPQNIVGQGVVVTGAKHARTQAKGCEQVQAIITVLVESRPCHAFCRCWWRLPRLRLLSLLQFQLPPLRHLLGKGGASTGKRQGVLFGYYSVVE